MVIKISKIIYKIKKRVGKIQTENLGLFLNKNLKKFSLINSLLKIRPERAAECGKVCIKKEGSL